jgi:hypothetical protein
VPARVFKILRQQKTDFEVNATGMDLPKTPNIGQSIYIQNHSGDTAHDVFHGT